jgi:hypothetical protein
MLFEQINKLTRVKLNGERYDMYYSPRRSRDYVKWLLSELSDVKQCSGDECDNNCHKSLYCSILDRRCLDCLKSAWGYCSDAHCTERDSIYCKLFPVFTNETILSGDEFEEKFRRARVQCMKLDLECDRCIDFLAGRDHHYMYSTPGVEMDPEDDDESDTDEDCSIQVEGLDEDLPEGCVTVCGGGVANDDSVVCLDDSPKKEEKKAVVKIMDENQLMIAELEAKFDDLKRRIQLSPILKLELEKLLNKKQKIDKLLIEFLKKFV